MDKNLGYHQKQTLFYALKAGKVLLKIQELCKKEKKDVMTFLKEECNISWSKSYYYFLISLFKFVKRYPKFKNVTISINDMSKNFSLIKKYVENNNKERRFWIVKV